MSPCRNWHAMYGVCKEHTYAVGSFRKDWPQRRGQSCELSCGNAGGREAGRKLVSSNLWQEIICKHSHLASRKNVPAIYAALQSVITPTYCVSRGLCSRRACRRAETAYDDVRHCPGEDAAVFLHIAVWWSTARCSAPVQTGNIPGSRSSQGLAYAWHRIGIYHIQGVAWAFSYFH